jgi:hypothetical protein
MAVLIGEIVTGEARGAVRKIRSRQGNSVWRVLLVSVPFLLILFGASWIVPLVGLPPEFDLTLSLLLLVGGLVGWVFTIRFVAMKGFRDRLTANGLATTFPLRIEIDAEALRYIVGDVTTVAEWACVTEVFESAGYWVFLAQASPLFAPKRYFADTAA